MPAMNTSRNRSTLHVASTTPYNRLINPSHSQNPTSQSPLPTNFAQYLSRVRTTPTSPPHIIPTLQTQNITPRNHQPYEPIAPSNPTLSPPSMTARANEQHTITT
ncbi:hypothetical protein HBI82_015910 [Parastagonospora nodorum]|nr:hypothetical protein HBH51_111860 [Parastagonospora nodorum]KAH4238388.1 hypothetical protein HBI06_037810 [Parastagonospora nodorum]KAH4238985.1 hypothetical protein HBI05_120790 [Parastagonospora nodorum]KAH4972377.1 hypothetical protein HBI78_026310 [Parastagonospora nodorum]KAH5226058.1 hypothetical protein HBH77_021970 [Parastagonospora nodorum]